MLISVSVERLREDNNIFAVVIACASCYIHCYVTNLREKCLSRSGECTETHSRVFRRRTFRVVRVLSFYFIYKYIHMTFIRAFLLFVVVCIVANAIFFTANVHCLYSLFEHAVGSIRLIIWREMTTNNDYYCQLHSSFHSSRS